MSALLATSASSLALAILSTILYRLFFHPLAGIPGPKFAAITRLWLAWHLRQGKSTWFQPELHKKYGPMVRISPNEVMFCSAEIVKPVYGAGSPFTKGEWYRVCAAPDWRTRGDDHFDLLTESNKDRYRLQRRAIGPAYSTANIERHQDILDTYLDKFVAKIRSFRGSYVGLSEWMHIFALDALSNVTLSKSLDYTSAGNDGGNMIGSDKHWAYFTVVGLFPWMVNLTQRIPKVGQLLMIPISWLFWIPVPTGLPIFHFAVPNVMARLSQAESTSSTELPADRPGLEFSNSASKNGTSPTEDDPEGEGKDLLSSVMKLHVSNVEKFRASWVLGITLTNFGAGHDNTTLTLSAAIYLLARNPSALQRLVKELQAAGVGAHTPYSEIASKAPYLMACLKESMRLMPAIGISLPRVVPPGGVTFCDTYLPPGTLVGTNLWALHHDASIFPEPEAFKPERWLEDGSSERKSEIGRMDACWLGFGGGSRSCPGQYLAKILAIKCLARLLCDFDVEVQGKPTFRGWFSVHMDGVDVSFRERT